jgi:hypothetical protein
VLTIGREIVRCKDAPYCSGDKEVQEARSNVSQNGEKVIIFNNP